MDINIGISDSDRERIADGLARVLADSYTLYLKTHNYHWNVTGPQFATLHTLFETQYSELALAIDQIAERIRALGRRAPGSYREYADLTAIAEDSDEPNAEEMIRRMVDGQETIVRTVREVFPVADSAARVRPWKPFFITITLGLSMPFS